MPAWGSAKADDPWPAKLEADPTLADGLPFSPMPPQA